jgi:hypothetical protein
MARVALASAVVLVVGFAGATASARVSDYREDQARQLTTLIAAGQRDEGFALGYLKASKLGAAQREVTLVNRELGDLRLMIAQVLSSDPTWMGPDPLATGIATGLEKIVKQNQRVLGAHAGAKFARSDAIYKLPVTTLAKMAADANLMSHPPCSVATTVSQANASSEPVVHFSFYCSKSVTNVQIDTGTQAVDKCDVASGDVCQHAAGTQITATLHGATPTLELSGATIAVGDEDTVRIQGDFGAPTFIDDVF